MFSFVCFVLFCFPLTRSLEWQEFFSLRVVIYFLWLLHHCVGGLWSWSTKRVVLSSQQDVLFTESLLVFMWWSVDIRLYHKVLISRFTRHRRTTIYAKNPTGSWPYVRKVSSPNIVSMFPVYLSELTILYCGGCLLVQLLCGLIAFLLFNLLLLVLRWAQSQNSYENNDNGNKVISLN